MSAFLALFALASAGPSDVLDCGAFDLSVWNGEEPQYRVSGHSMHWPYGTGNFESVEGSLDEGLRLTWTIRESTAHRRGPRDLVVTLDVTGHDRATGRARYAIEGVAPPPNPRVPATIRRIQPFEGSGECVAHAPQEETPEEPQS
ncbi:hypothetical protein [Parvibaculum sp.]|uniref:hypothetical protein n=1 Tax=Parvibaculum sp. TaxID=2024848 RepID=UPI00262A3B9E|nr:hypothetical protein [uncultured Parasphingopyxis sp.]